MRFTLTYSGPLRSKQKDPLPGRPDKKAAHVHNIRTAFHKQLGVLWSTNRFLSDAKVWRSDYGEKAHKPDGMMRISGDPSTQEPLVNVIADVHQNWGYRFVPLVREGWNLQCELDILFLRQDMPGGLIHAGDIDNRVKTLLDSLRMPQNEKELGDLDKRCAKDSPFFVLMEDDKLISSLRVDTDRLLDVPDDAPQDFVRLVISVETRAHTTTMFNLGFV